MFYNKCIYGLVALKFTIYLNKKQVNASVRIKR